MLGRSRVSQPSRALWTSCTTSAVYRYNTQGSTLLRPVKEVILHVSVTVSYHTTQLCIFATPWDSVFLQRPYPQKSMYRHNSLHTRANRIHLIKIKTKIHLRIAISNQVYAIWRANKQKAPANLRYPCNIPCNIPCKYPKIPSLYQRNVSCLVIYKNLFTRKSRYKRASLQEGVGAVLGHNAIGLALLGLVLGLELVADAVVLLGEVLLCFERGYAS